MGGRGSDAYHLSMRLGLLVKGLARSQDSTAKSFTTVSLRAELRF